MGQKKQKDSAKLIRNPQINQQKDEKPNIN